MIRCTLGLCAALLLASCTSDENHSGPKQEPAPPAAPPAAPGDVVEVPALPSQAEADAKAAAAISKENADAELEKLKQELGGG